MARTGRGEGATGRGALWVVALVAAVAAAGWLALGDRGAADGDPDAPARSGAAEARSPAASELAPMVEEPEATSSGRSEVDVEAQQRTAEVPVASTARDTGLFARAVGPDGEPVPGVAVEWVVRSKLGDVGESPIRGVTGQDGVLEIEDGEEFVDVGFGGGLRASYVAAVGLRCAMPFEELAPTREDPAPGVTWLDARPEPGAVIDVTVPAYGFVRFTWKPPMDPRGGALDATWLQVRRSDGDHFPGWRWGGALPEGVTEFTFGPVGLGWEVWGGLSRRDLEGRLGQGTGAGPVAMRGTVEVPIEIAEAQRDLVALRGRIVHATGVTKRRDSVWIRFGPPEDEDAHGHRAPTDEDGRFEVLLPRTEVPRTLTLMDNYARIGWIGSRAVPPPPSDGVVVDVGDVEVDALPEEDAAPELMIVAGRVVDAMGAPVEGAGVAAFGHATSIGGRERDPERFFMLASGRTGGDGRFELTGAVVLARDAIRIQASSEGFQKAPMVPANAGAADVELTLHRGVDVRFQLDVPRWALMMEAVSMNLGRGNHGARADRGAGEGAIAMRFRGVPDGTHTFTIELGQGDWPLHTEEVVVAGGDVDLGLVDLSDALRICPVRLVDSGGSPVKDGYASVRTGPWEGSPSGEIDSIQVGDGGEVTFIVPRDAGDLRVVHTRAGSAAIPAEAIVRAIDSGDVRRVEVVLGP